MRLRPLANSVTSVINNNQDINWLQSYGFTTDAAGKRSAGYAPATIISAQIQPLSGSDLRHMDGLNIQGVMRSVYMYGNIQGVVRADQKGGDMLQFPEIPGGDQRNWIVTQVMETWPTWCRVIVTLQAQ